MITKKEAISRELKAALKRMEFDQQDGADLIKRSKCNFNHKINSPDKFTLGEILQLDKVLGTEIINPALMEKYKKVF